MDKIMKDFSKSDLLKGARHYFEDNNTETLYATSDGQYFLKKGPAANHAGEKLAVYELLKKDQDKQPETNTVNKPEKGMTISELVSFIQGITDIAELQAMKTKELAGENRIGAIKVLDLRIFILETEQSEDLEKIKGQLEAEQNGEKRKTAIAALEARIEQLTESAE